MAKITTPRFETPVLNDAGETIGWWWLEDDMITVRSLSGATKSAGRSASNETLARIMLSER